MGKMKQDSVEFTTQRSIRDLTQALRRAINATKAEVEELDDDPLDMEDDVKPQVAVLLSGSNFMGGSRMWGVQVVLYDLGDRRVAELIALGDSFGAGVMSYYTGGYFELRDGKHRRDKILAILTENDPTVKKGVVLDDEPAAATPSYPEMNASPSAPSRGKSAAAQSTSPAHYPVSPDGVDPNTSVLFGKMLQNKAASAKYTHDDMVDFAYKLFGLDCEKFADLHPDFPARSELKAIRGDSADEGSQERYLYQPYLDMFPGENEALKRGIGAICDWVEPHEDDPLSVLLYADIFVIGNNYEKANIALYRVLLLESRGADVKDLQNNWAGTALTSGFENWYVRQFASSASPRPAQTTAAQPKAAQPKAAQAKAAAPSDMPLASDGVASSRPAMQGGDRTPARPAAQTAPARSTAQSSDRAPARSTAQSSDRAPAHSAAQTSNRTPAHSASQPSAGHSRHAANQPSRSAKAGSAGSNKIVLYTAIAAVVLILIAAVGDCASFVSLVAPALWLAFVFLKRPADDPLMTVPATILAVLSLVNGFGYSFFWTISTLLILAIAVVYWLFALKVGLNETTSSRLLVFMLGIRALLNLILNLGEIRYSILYFLGTLGSCALMLSIAAQIYTDTKDAK